jgi:hypothetical protein
VIEAVSRSLPASKPLSAVQQRAYESADEYLAE